MIRLLAAEISWAICWLDSATNTCLLTGMLLQRYCDQFESNVANEYARASRQVVEFPQAKEEDQAKEPRVLVGGPGGGSTRIW